MATTYQITEQDYVDGMRLHQQANRTATISYIIMFGSLAFLTVFGSDQIRVLAIGGLVGGVSVILFFRLLFLPMTAKRHYRKYKTIQEPVTIDLRGKGIKFTTTDTNSLVTWDKILKWRQNDRFILIYPMPQIFYLVKKDITKQGFDLKALIDALTTHVGKPS
jgi:hypothetical protein